MDEGREECFVVSVWGVGGGRGKFIDGSKINNADLIAFVINKT
jgi:hypothetical protein